MNHGEVRFGPFRLNLDRRELTRDGVVVRLGSRALDILCELVAAEGQLVTKDELMARVWPGAVIEENAIQVHVSGLRKVLDGGNVGLSLLARVAGRGYRFAGSMQKTTAGNPDVGDAFHGKPSIA